MDQKKLSVILFTDMVNYSKKVQENEERALRILDTHNEILEGIIREHQGHIIKTIGDSFFVSFDSVNSAIQCAADIQQQIQQHNSTSTPGEQFEVRIGIHAGDVFIKNEDVFGDGVNIASRIESSANTNEILISEEVYFLAKNKALYPFVYKGARQLKNIEEPVQIYEVDWRNEKKRTQKQRTWVKGVSLGLAAIIVALTAFYLHLINLPDFRSLIKNDRPTLLILDFDNAFNTEQTQDMNLGQVVADALIKKFSESSTALPIGAIKVAKTIHDLQLQGSVFFNDLAAAEKVSQTMDANVLITGQVFQNNGVGSWRIESKVIDTLSGALLGSYHIPFDSPDQLLISTVEELFLKINDRISHQYNLVSTRPFVDIGELTTKNPRAYSYFLKGHHLIQSGSYRPGVSEVLKALEIDPDFAMAYSVLFCASYDFQDREEGRKYAEIMKNYKDRFDGKISKEALIYNGNLAWSELRIWDVKKYYSLLIELYPDDMYGYYYLAQYLSELVQQKEKSLTYYKKARALNPGHFPIYRGEALVYVDQDNPEKAVELLKEYIKNFPDNPSVDYARRTIAEIRGA